MSGLRELLVEAADDAREYDVTDRALRIVRRRRTAARLVPVAAALMVIAGLLAVGLPFGGGGRPGAEPVAAAGLPGRLTPDASPPMLPPDRGVGRAALAFLGGDDGRGDAWVLLTADGRQYRVDGLLVYGLSPDGRWLLVRRADGVFVLRDLTGTARQEFPGGDPTSVGRWSPDGRRFVVQIADPASRAVATSMVDLATGARTPVPLDPASPERVCALRDSGVLVLCAAPGSPFSGLRLADAATGRITGEVTTAQLGLEPGEAVPAGAGVPQLGPDGRTLYLSTRGRHEFLVGYDLDAGRLSERYTLPDPSPAAVRSAANGGVESGVADQRLLLGLHADGPLLLHLTPGRGDAFTTGSVSVELVERDSGRLRPVMLVDRPITVLCYPG